MTGKIAATLTMLALLASAYAGDIPLHRAEVGNPVIQQLMGGCSLTCSFPWSASAGTTPDPIPPINDGQADTAWTTARVGDKLTFRFPADLPRELDGTPFYGIDVVNGRIHPLAEFKDYGRVKDLLLSHNGRPALVMRLADTPRWQRIEFDDIYLDVGDTLTLEIRSIYPARSGNPAALTEIVLQGAH